jgi:hypothetical protein
MNRGVSLIELLVSLGLSTLVLLGLFLLTRGGTRQFELSSQQVFLGQKAREAVEDTLSLACSAVTPFAENAQMIYSPAPGCSQSDLQYPNVYSLDFASCCDFLDPEFTSNPEGTRGYLDRRGGTRFRYRIRFDLPTEKLLLERLTGASVAGLPTVDSSVPARVLCQGVERITFDAVANTIQMSVGSATVKRSSGNLQGGVQDTDSRRELDRNAPVKQQARRLQIFTVVTIPARTTR